MLAVDPSSASSGGSILGDKTRMPTLSADQRAYIRPSPSRGTLGGVARRTQDVMCLVEAAGYDRVIVETVGVGQSEIAVASMVDVFVLLVPPGAGDELQGIKRGIMELADICVVTKADGNLRPAAAEAARQLRAALKVMRPRSTAWAVPVLEVSSVASAATSSEWPAGVGGAPPNVAAPGPVPPLVTSAASGEGAAGSGDVAALDAGAAARSAAPSPPTTRRRRRGGAGGGGAAAPSQSPVDVAATLEDFRAAMEAAGQLEARRRAQAVAAVREQTFSGLIDRLGRAEEAEAAIRQMATAVAEGHLATSQAADRVVDELLRHALAAAAQEVEDRVVTP